MNLKHIKFIVIAAGISFDRLLLSKQIEHSVSDVSVIDPSKDISKPSLKHLREELEKYPSTKSELCIKILDFNPDCLLRVTLKKKTSPRASLKSYLLHKNVTRLPEAKARSPSLKGVRAYLFTKFLPKQRLHLRP